MSRIKQPFELNPILKREVRARWRNWPAFLTLFLYAVFLAVALGWRYTDVMATPSGVSTQNAPARGRELFNTMTMVQALGWMLLAPVLTATSIAGERERGTLSGLLLSGLTPHQIASGKLLSALSFIALMLVVPLPIVALCFPLGGVSPGEFVMTALLHAGTAVACAALGLMASANNRRASAAIGWALAAVALWCVIPPLSFFSPLAALMLAMNSTVALTVPLALIYAIVVPLCVLKYAASAILRALPDPPPVPRVSQLNALGAATLEAQYAAPEAEAQPDALTKWRRLPLVSSLRFDNPVLQREVRIRLQMRAGAWGTESQNSPGCWLSIGFFFLIFGLMLALSNDPEGRFITWATFSHLWLFAVMIGMTLIGALAFAREREQGMLQPLMLSLLTRRDILLGKLVGALVVCAYFSLAVLPVLVPCLRGLVNTHGAAFSESALGIGVGTAQMTLLGISLCQAGATALVIVATAWSCAACGLLMSWFSRQTWIATGGALGLVFLVNAGLPLYLGRAEGAATLLNRCLPLYAMHYIIQGEPILALNNTLWLLAIHGTVGLLLLLVIHIAMRGGARETDRTV